LEGNKFFQREKITRTSKTNVLQESKKWDKLERRVRGGEELTNQVFHLKKDKIKF